MIKKIILGVLIFLLLAGAGYFIAKNRGLISPPATEKETSPTEKASVEEVAVIKSGNGYILHGRLSTNLELRSDGNMETLFILTGDPNQKEIRALIVPQEGLVSILKYEGNFSGTVKVDRLESAAIEKMVKSGDRVEFSMSIPSGKPLKGYETLMKEGLDSLAAGSWEISSSDLFIITTNSIGIVQ